jgi:hypothetical protein
MPKECQVGHTTEVRVLIALKSSKGLRAFLPDFTVSRELIARSDVQKAGVPIEFPCEENTDQLLPAHLQIVIDAPGFHVRQAVQQILVPPDKDSGMLTFFLMPRSSQPIGRVSVKLYQDKDLSITLGSVTLTTTVRSQHVEGIAGPWQLTMFPADPSPEVTVSEVIETHDTTNEATPDQDVHDAPAPRLRRRLPVEMQAAIVGALATLIAAVWATGLGTYVFDLFASTAVPVSPTPACITEDDILVRLQVWNGQLQIGTFAPSARIELDPNMIVDLQVDFTSVSGEALPALQCVWENANMTNSNTATEGKLLHTDGCRVDYRSGHTKIEDALRLQVGQESCPGLPPYAFFIFAR